MTDKLKDVLQGTKRIEAILEEKFGSTGRGLYEKMTTANMKLPEPLQKRIRYVATMRNKAMHEEGFEIPNIPEYVKTCQSIAEQLEGLHANRKPGLFSQGAGGWMRKVALIGCAGAGIFGLAYLGMATALKYEQPSRVAAAHDVGEAKPAPARAQEQPTAPTAAARPARANPPAPAAVVKAAAAPAQADVDQSTETTSPSAPVTFKNLKFSMKKDGWGSLEPNLSATFTNNHSATISSIRVKARLFINGETTPVAGNTRSDGEFFVFFGDSGLAPGASASPLISFFGFDKDSWKVPDVINAKTRVVEMQIIDAKDGRKSYVKVPNTGWQR